MEQNLEVLASLFLQLWNDQSVSAAHQIFDPGFEDTRPGESQPVRGIDAVMAYIREVHVGFPDFKLSLKHILQDENYVVLRWVTAGTHNGAFQGIPATGRRVEMSGLTIVEMKSGKAIREEVYFDRLHLLEQLGVIGTPPQNKAAASS